MLREAALTLLYYAAPLCLTVLIEAGVAHLCRLKKEEQHALLLCNLLTNPFLNLIIYLKSYWTGSGFPFPLMLLLEGLIVIGEGLLLRRILGHGRPYLALSLLFNGVSYGMGLLLSALTA